MRLLLLLSLLVGCAAGPPPASRALPLDDDDSAETQTPAVSVIHELGYVHGAPVPRGARLALTALRIDCASGPDPALDNEDPLAEATARWLVTFDARGWASVTDPPRLFVWDGALDPQLATHALAVTGREPMGQSPGGSSAEPFGFDRWAQQIPVFDDAQVAGSLGGTTLSCLDGGGGLDAAAHDVMLCALDARDLQTRHCWFCGDHFGEPAGAVGDAVGRIGAPGIPGLPPLSVTEQVTCAYGPTAARD